MKNKQSKCLKAIVMSLLLASVLFVGCKDDNPDETQPAPVIALNNTLLVRVTNLKDVAVNGCAVKLEGEGFSSNKVADASGVVTFDGLLKSGNYKVSVSKSGFIQSTSLEAIVIPVANGFKGTKNIVLAEAVAPKNIDATGGNIAVTPPSTSESTSIAYDFKIESGALTKTEPISITPTTTRSYPVAPSTNSMSVLTINCQPDGTSFSKPAVLKVVPFGNYIIADASLLMYNSANSTWVKQDGALNVVGNAYEVSINHFSDYQIACNFSTITKTTNVESLLIKNVDNISGKKEQTIGDVVAVSKSGYEFVETPTAVLTAAGITGNDATEIANTILKMVNSYLGVAKTGFVPTNVTTPINAKVSVGYAVSIHSATEYETISFVLPLKKDGATKNITIQVKTVKSFSLKTTVRAGEHQGGGASGL